MDRNEFLQNFWRRYPPMPKGAVSVAEVSGLAGDFWLCGRLREIGDGFLLLSDESQSLRIPLSEPMIWADESCEFSTDLLVVGDVLALGVVQGQARTVRLLACCEKPWVGPAGFSQERSCLWSNFLHFLRTFFRRRGFIEITTPTLVPSPGIEAFLEPFSTEFHFGRNRRQLYLPTSPELHLKKMLNLGWRKIFEIKTCFRNGELSAHHQPEFQMLEWYRSYADLDSIVDDVEQLLTEAQAAFASGTSVALEKISMSDLFARRFPGFQLRPETTREDLVNLASQVAVAVREDDSWDEIFFRLFLEKIEPLGVSNPILVRGYPPSQAALSRLDAQGFADRFEVYWRGLEIANAFHELTDPAENLRRLQLENAKKQKLGLAEVPLDPEFLSALQSGLPPSGGIALGVDRLFMALFGIENIADSRTFPLSIDR